MQLKMRIIYNIFEDNTKKDLETYEIVGLNESDILNNKISYEFPLGKALLNKKMT